MLPCWCGWQKMRKRLYLSPLAKIGKTKGTLFPSTFKVWENKVPFVLSILAQGLRYSHFLIFSQPCKQGAILEFRKWLYFSLWAKIEKTKGILFSQTLKVEENKVPLVFSILALGLRYSYFLIFCRQHQKVPSKSLENCYISAHDQKFWKLRALYFLKL